MAENSRPVLKTRAMQVVEIEHGEPVGALLRRLYVTEGMSQAAIAQRLGLDQGTVSRWMRDFGVDVPVIGPRRRSVA